MSFATVEVDQKNCLIFTNLVPIIVSVNLGALGVFLFFYGFQSGSLPVLGNLTEFFEDIWALFFRQLHGIHPTPFGTLLLLSYSATAPFES